MSIPRKLKIPRVAWALFLVVIVALAGWPSLAMRYIPDAPEYRQFAVGGPSLVHNPYSERVFHPLLVHLVSQATSLGIDSGFLAVAAFMLIAFALIMSAILDELGAPAPAIIVLMFGPLLVTAFQKMYFQDLTQWTLIAIFFWLMMRDLALPAIVFLMLAYLTRESAVLLLAAVVLAGFLERDFRLIIGGVVAAIVAVAIASAFGARGLPNDHHVNLLIFLLLKVPFEFARNVLGLYIVPSTLTHVPGNQCTPVFVVNLPKSMRIGGLTWVSYCGWRAKLPLGTLSALLTLFGVCPAVVLALALRRPDLRKILERKWLVVALIYGVVAYWMGTSEGTALDREIGSAWPLFWVALPALAGATISFTPSMMGRLAAYNLIVSWMPHPIQWASHYSNVGLTVTILIAFVFQYFAYSEVLNLSKRTGAIPTSMLPSRNLGIG